MLRYSRLLIIFAILASPCVSGCFTLSARPVPGFYNELMEFSIEVKGISVGSILMRTVQTGETFLQINTKVQTFKMVEPLYYIAGNFGAMWNYRDQKSYMAYEDVYDGYMYMRRAYRFQEDNRIYVNKREVRFFESGLPHGDVPEKDSTREYYIEGTEFQDLLGVFYTLRSMGVSPQPGEIYKLKVLPAGVKKIMIIQVIDKLVVNVPPLGGDTRVIHVKSGLATPGNKLSGGNIFFNVQSALDLYFTDDENAIPVRIWAKVPIIKRADVVLTQYLQSSRKKNKK